jgi:hypothetical protein
VRRLVGRAHPPDREAVTLTGVFRRAADLASEASTGGKVPSEGTDDSTDTGEPEK